MVLSDSNAGRYLEIATWVHIDRLKDERNERRI